MGSLHLSHSSSYLDPSTIEQVLDFLEFISVEFNYFVV